MEAVKALAKTTSVRAACHAVDLARATFYRHRAPRRETPPRPSPRRKLAPGERRQVLDVLNSERFCDKAPHQVWGALLDQGTYLCSVRTMYRILAQEGQVRERRDQLRHPSHVKPELVATAPNQLWSWDITKLLGPRKWTYYYLYVILDVYSRYVPGWMVATRESASLAARLIQETTERQGVVSGQLTLHADRGSAPASKAVAQLLADLGVTKSHSRPHVSNDNAFSEAQFKTFKYRPEFPDRFGSQEHARVVCQDLFTWYNGEHLHSGIGLLTPETVHYGRAPETLGRRARVLQRAFSERPERFVRGCPTPPDLPEMVWINRPTRALEVGH